MGTTAATLHIVVPQGASTDLPSSVQKTYAKLGWAPPRRGEPAARTAILTRNGPYLTINDTACDGLDDGTLQNLAAMLSKSLKTAAIVTMVYDSDQFTFLLFHAGKQIDAITDSSDGRDPALKALTGKRQANAWLTAFASGIFQTAMAEAGRRMAAQLDLFVQRAKSARALETPFAENRLAAWCALACLPIEAATAAADEVGERAIATIALAPRPVAAKPASETVPVGREFTFFQSDDDDCPYHGFFPAPWPCVPLARQVFMWGVVCRNGGLAQFRVRLHLDRTGPFAVRHIQVQAWSFHAGQIVSEKPLAEAAYDVPDSTAHSAADISMDAPVFSMRGPAPGSKAQAILLIRVTVAAPAAGQMRITPVFEPDGGQAPLALPPLLLEARAPEFVPLVATETVPRPAEIRALMRLNLPSINSAAAIVPDAGEETRAAVRRMLERFLTQFRGNGLTAEIRTQKHLTPSANLPRSRTILPLAELHGAKAWPKYFDSESNYQTVRIFLTPPGAPWAYAGLSVQTDLAMRHRDAPPVLKVSIWANAAPEALAALDLNWIAALDDYTGWLRGAEPIQGWATSVAWIPVFDTYEDFERTPYETLAARQTINAISRQAEAANFWPERPLKFMAPRLWLGKALAARIDTAVVMQTADLLPAGTSLEIRLKPGRPLGELERALAPILPGEGLTYAGGRQQGVLF